MTNIFQVGWFNHQPARIGENVFTALFTLDPWRVGLNRVTGAACGFSGFLGLRMNHGAKKQDVHTPMPPSPTDVIRILKGGVVIPLIFPNVP